MCFRADCDTEGTHVPQVVVMMRDPRTRETWRIPAVVGLLVCDACKGAVRTPHDVLADGGDAIVQKLLKLRARAVCVGRTLAWTTVDDPTYKALQERRLS